MSDEIKAEISFDQFAALDLRVAKVIEAREHPNADKLMILKLDMGPLGERQICAGIRQYYTPDELTGKLIAVVANLAPRKMRGEISEGMLLAGVEEGHEGANVVVMTLEKPVAPGSKIS